MVVIGGFVLLSIISPHDLFIDFLLMSYRIFCTHRLPAATLLVVCNCIFLKFTFVAMDVTMDIAKNIRPMRPHNKDHGNSPYCGVA